MIISVKGAYVKIMRNTRKNIFRTVTKRGWYEFLARYQKTRNASLYFTFRGKRYPYFYHPYNTTWRNMRALEIPITEDAIRNAIKNNPLAKILEVGNVLSHYFQVSHQILDK